MKNDLLLRVLRGEPVPRTPVWMMRQAGRYLPEYRATREAAGQFMTLCQTPELACEVTLQPLARFRLDAAILFSDILTIPDAMGLGLSFVPGEGPAFDRPVRSHADVQALPIPDMHDDLGYVMQAVRLIRRELDGSVPLIGFAGSPWTLAHRAVSCSGVACSPVMICANRPSSSRARLPAARTPGNRAGSHMSRRNMTLNTPGLVSANST